MSRATDFLLRFTIGSVIVFFAARASATPEAARTVLAQAEARYAELEQGEMTIMRRSIHFTIRGNSDDHETRRATFQRLLCHWRPKEDWRFVFQREDEQNSQISNAATLVFAKTGEDGGLMLMMNLSNRQPVELKLPSQVFLQEARQRMAPLAMDPVLMTLQSRGAPESGPGLRMLTDLSLGGQEEIGGVRCVRINGRAGISAVSVWIDAETKLVVLARETREFPGQPRMTAFPEVSETVYSYSLDKAPSDESFDPHAGWAQARPGLSVAGGFGPVSGVIAWYLEPIRAAAAHAESGRARETPPPGQSRPRPTTPLSPPAMDRSASSGAVAAPQVEAPKLATPPEGQLLTPEQMAAIVLVEGDDGAGTGFVTLIRGLPFVVTNLHVIGGAQRLRVTTLTGARLEVGPIHGAVGRDLAILRVEGDPPAATLKLAENPLRTAKIGDKVVVVGNRRGGGVATQVSGMVQGIGPDKVEVDAAFQPGNSGSPIVHVETGEVIGLAAYAQTRRLDALDGAPARNSAAKDADEPKVEQRWFGYRIDGVSSWQAVDLARWREQARKIDAFRADSEALYYAMLGRFERVRGSPSVSRVIDRFDERFSRSGPRQVQTAQDVGEFFRSLRALTENGKRELRDGDYYDYFRSSLYWETSIPEQLRTREQIAKYLDRASENSSAFLSRLRN